MSELKSEFTRTDIETLIESVGDWETVGNHEYHVLNMIKNAPMPPEGHEAFEPMTQIKDYFKSREKSIIASRETRQEKAVFLKAKLMMVRRDMGIDQLFDMAACAEEVSPLLAPKERPQLPAPQETPKAVVAEGSLEEALKKLQLAEEFIKDMGVTSYYEKFLAEQKNSSC